jgi:hypothetical protein
MAKSVATRAGDMKRVKRAEYALRPTAAALDQHRVAAVRGWKGVTPGWAYPRRCHERAYRFVRDNPEPPPPFAADRLRFVQGLYWPAGLPWPTPHSWVEVADDVVFDGVMQAFYRTAGYRDVLDARPVLSLTPAEMFDAILAAGREGETWELFDPLDCRPVVKEMVRRREAGDRLVRRRKRR